MLLAADLDLLVNLHQVLTRLLLLPPCRLLLLSIRRLTLPTCRLLCLLRRDRRHRGRRRRLLLLQALDGVTCLGILLSQPMHLI